MIVAEVRVRHNRHSEPRNRPELEEVVVDEKEHVGGTPTELRILLPILRLVVQTLVFLVPADTVAFLDAYRITHGMSYPKIQLISVVLEGRGVLVAAMIPRPYLVLDHSRPSIKTERVMCLESPL